MFKSAQKAKRGFTIIELLVVIGIIGVLSTIVLANVGTSYKKGRDARRISDLKQIQLALELYYDANGSFPGTIYSNTLEGGGYIPKVPTDPSSTQVCTDGNIGSSQRSCYAYTPYRDPNDNDGTGGVAPCVSYHLAASLEASNPELNNDADIVANNSTQIQVPNSSPARYYSVCTRAGSPASGDFYRTDAQSCNNNQTWGVSCYDIKP